MFARVSISIAAGLVALGSFAQARSEQPNIVLIFADDLGWKDVAYQGTDFYETPCIDRLAREGMVKNATSC